jgi:steroid 5-alpha reductase family enzyme
VDLTHLGAAYLTGLAAALIFLTIVFSFAKRMQRYDVIDSAWGLSFILITLTALASNHTALTSYQLIASGLVIVWGLRLSWHIFRRWRRSSQQDPRYTALSQSWRGSVARTMYFRVYVVQAILASLVTLPIVIIITADTQPRLPLFSLGILVWAFGFIYEAIADHQLKQFASQPNNKGKLLQHGLWAYSRHPNYFGEVTLWWGFVLLALSLPYGWLGILGGITITILITKVSGVPPSEQRMARRDGWEAYARSTNRLIPRIR